MKVIRIIQVIEKYSALKSRLYGDKLDYENYKTLEPDEEKEKLYLHKVVYDYEEIAKFLDTEV